jgi:hypothetical protein
MSPPREFDRVGSSAVHEGNIGVLDELTDYFISGIDVDLLSKLVECTRSHEVNCKEIDDCAP